MNRRRPRNPTKAASGSNPLINKSNQQDFGTAGTERLGIGDIGSTRSIDDSDDIYKPIPPRAKESPNFVVENYKQIFLAASFIVPAVWYAAITFADMNSKIDYATDNIKDIKQKIDSHNTNLISNNHKIESLEKEINEIKIDKKPITD